MSVTTRMKRIIHSSIESRIRLFAFLKTLYLFGKSDIPAALLPSLTISLILANPSRLSLVSLLKAFLWILLHLLAFQVKNQIDGLPEDKISKPYRPLAANRISPADAQRLYHALLLLMWAAAVYLKTTAVTAVYSLAILGYNEGRLARVALLKNGIGGVGLAKQGPRRLNDWPRLCYDRTFPFHSPPPPPNPIIPSPKPTSPSNKNHIHQQGHAQDFRDRTADTLMKRTTLPLLLPQRLARSSLAALICLWTGALVWLWEPPVVVAALFGVLAVGVAGRFSVRWDEEADAGSYVAYAVGFPSPF
ncbi:hypothetical protein BJY00DRAFT_318261 [Aspergillus carlsbadensis]|nr:hypothetical protein BJY00DRAFT_318261 [Aspergillus carlsbadensis]